MSSTFPPIVSWLVAGPPVLMGAPASTVVATVMHPRVLEKTIATALQTTAYGSA
jgi:hypothetical protein